MKKLIVIFLLISFGISQINLTVYTTNRVGKVGEFETKLVEKVIALYESKNKVKVNTTFVKLQTFAEGFTKLKEAGNNEVCVINSVTITDERKKMYNFTAPYIPTRDAILVLTSKKFANKDVWKKKGTRIAYTPGTTGETIIKDLKKQYSIVGGPFENRAARLAALTTGKTEFAVGDNILAWDDPTFSVLNEIEGRKTGYFGMMFSKNSKMKAEFDKTFSYFVKSTSFRKLTTSVFGNQIAEFFRQHLK
jgi:hypothetical protein